MISRSPLHATRLKTAGNIHESKKQAHWYIDITYDACTSESIQNISFHFHTKLNRSHSQIPGGRWGATCHKWLLDFLALLFRLCQQSSWNRNSSFVRSSVRGALISEPNASISFKFWLLRPLDHTLWRFCHLKKKNFLKYFFTNIFHIHFR